MRRQSKPPPSFPALVQAFFVEHLTQQRALSPQTVAAYRDAFVLFLGFAEARLGRSPALITLADITPDLITAFLDHLEREAAQQRAQPEWPSRGAAFVPEVRGAPRRDIAAGDRARTRRSGKALRAPDARLSLPGGNAGGDRYAGWNMVQPKGSCVGAVALQHRCAGFRDRTGVKVGEVVLDDGAACVHLHGKGRKQRSVPLWRSTIRAIRAWLQTKSAVRFRLATAAQSRWPSNVAMERDAATGSRRPSVATESCPELATRHISPHVIRHTTAMHLLQAGVDISVIALWLGHESPATTHQYVEADLAMKERALARLQEPETKLRRYRAPDSLIDFLRTL